MIAPYGQPHPHRCTALHSRWLSVVVAAACLTALAGCNVLGAVAGRAPERPIRSPAIYDDLKGRSVAVIVAADPTLEARFGQALDQLMLRTSMEIKRNIPEITLIDPVAVQRLTRENPYWPVMAYSRLADMLDVDRIILVDLSSFELRNPHQQQHWLGQARALVGVIERENTAHRRLAVQAPVTATFPEGQRFGLTSGSEHEITDGLSRNLARRIGELFYTHTVN